MESKGSVCETIMWLRATPVSKIAHGMRVGVGVGPCVVLDLRLGGPLATGRCCWYGVRAPAKLNTLSLLSGFLCA